MLVRRTREVGREVPPGMMRELFFFSPPAQSTYRALQGTAYPLVPTTRTQTSDGVTEAVEHVTVKQVALVPNIKTNLLVNLQRTVGSCRQSVKVQGQGGEEVDSSHRVRQHASRDTTRFSSLVVGVMIERHDGPENGVGSEIKLGSTSEIGVEHAVRVGEKTVESH